MYLYFPEINWLIDWLIQQRGSVLDVDWKEKGTKLERKMFCVLECKENMKLEINEGGGIPPMDTFKTRQSEMADLARRATRDLSQFHMGGPNFDTGRSWKL